MKIVGKIIILFLIFFIMTGLCYGQSDAEKRYSKGLDFAVQGKFKEAKMEWEKDLKVDPSNEFAIQALKVIEDFTDKKIERKTAIHLFKTYALS
jgi:hypothetical protein